MSDDSDWSSDGEHDAPASIPPPPSNANANPAPVPTPAPAAAAVAPASAPQIILAFPVRIFTASGAHPVLSGFSVLVDCSPSVPQFTLLLYDSQTKRPLAGQVLSGNGTDFSLTESEFANDDKYGLCFRWRPSATVQVAQRINLQFQGEADFQRFQLLVATIIARHSANPEISYSNAILPLSTECKLLKPTSSARVSVKAYSSNLRSLSTAEQWTQACKDLQLPWAAAPSASAIFTEAFTLEIPDFCISSDSAPPSVLPSLRVHYPNPRIRLKERRLLCCPGDSKFVQEAQESAGKLITANAEETYYFIIEPVEIVKKKDKKDKKKVLALPPPTEATQTTENGNGAQQNTQSEASATPSQAPSSSPSDSSVASSSASLSESCDSLGHSVSALPRVQIRLLKLVLQGIFEGISSDIDVNTDNASTLEPSTVLDSLQQRIRVALSEFQDKNSGGQPGTIAAVKEEADKLIQLVKNMPPPQAAAPVPVVNPVSEKALTEAKNDAFKANQKLKEAQQQIAQLNEALKAESQKVAKANEEVKKKSEMCTVFEGGLTELRQMLEREINEKNEAREAFRQLQQVNNKLKLTWINDDRVRRCMMIGCKKEFKKGFGFGPSKVHCRCCGRVFCSDHCGGKFEAAMPEFGFKPGESLKVCVNCFNMKKEFGEAKEPEPEPEEAEPMERPVTKGKAQQQTQPAQPTKSQPKKPAAAQRVSTGFDDLDDAFE